MRHHRQTHRLNRSKAERTALIENMVSSLLTHQTIQTTLQKAKVARRLADRIISLGKKDTLASRRQVFSYLQDHTLTSKVFKEVAPRFKSRNGGYTRILQLSRRKGDGAQLALLELTEKEIKVKEPKKSKKKDGKVSTKPAHDHEHKHAKDHEAHAPETKAQHAAPEKEPRSHKPEESPKAKPKTGFFKNLGKFFRNKGGS